MGPVWAEVGVSVRMCCRVLTAVPVGTLPRSIYLVRARAVQASGHRSRFRAFFKWTSRAPRGPVQCARFSFWPVAGMRGGISLIGGPGGALGAAAAGRRAPGARRARARARAGARAARRNVRRFAARAPRRAAARRRSARITPRAGPLAISSSLSLFFSPDSAHARAAAGPRPRSPSRVAGKPCKAPGILYIKRAYAPFNSQLEEINTQRDNMAGAVTR